MEVNDRYVFWYVFLNININLPKNMSYILLRLFHGAVVFCDNTF